MAFGNYYATGSVQGLRMGGVAWYYEFVSVRLDRGEGKILLPFSLPNRRTESVAQHKKCDRFHHKVLFV